jgi:hypothetical protein
MFEKPHVNFTVPSPLPQMIILGILRVMTGNCEKLMQENDTSRNSAAYDIIIHFLYG